MNELFYVLFATILNVLDNIKHPKLLQLHGSSRWARENVNVLHASQIVRIIDLQCVFVSNYFYLGEWAFLRDISCTVEFVRSHQTPTIIAVTRHERINASVSKTEGQQP